MEMSGIKLVYDTDTHLWGWEGITLVLKGQKSDIKHPNRTIAILDAASKILNAYQYNVTSPAKVTQVTQVAQVA
jgi:alpha-tubulin suppressor-like RCC1 family protein